MENIVVININELKDYPRQAEIYGTPEIEPEFIASIKDRGIITPLLVSAVLTDDRVEYVIVSGHRRKYNAKEAGLTELPCIVRNYLNPADMEIDFLAANMQREKSKAVRLKEYLTYKQILSQFGKERKSKGIYADTIFENDMFFRICKTHNIEFEGKALNSAEILKDITNFSRYEQDQLNIIYGAEWLEKRINELRDLGLPSSSDNQIFDNMAKIRSAYEAEEISLNEAARSIKDMFNDAENALKPKKKSKPEPKPKAEPSAVWQKPKIKPLLEQIMPWEYKEAYRFKLSDSFAVCIASQGQTNFMVFDLDGISYTVNKEQFEKLIKAHVEAL